MPTVGMTFPPILAAGLLNECDRLVVDYGGTGANQLVVRGFQRPAQFAAE